LNPFSGANVGIKLSKQKKFSLIFSFFPVTTGQIRHDSGHFHGKIVTFGCALGRMRLGNLCKQACTISLGFHYLCFE
jgi:hypothetical protein